ncbi:putative dioxygenase [Xylariales sp. PMI_506]|nr:putative dioxygenase [Xylariales sp. PMI_506]
MLAPWLNLWLLAILAPVVTAHPGEDLAAEVLSRREFLAQTPHLQKRCAASLAQSGHTQRSIERRRALAEELRSKLDLPPTDNYIGKRSLTTVLATDHNHTVDYPNATFATPADSFFTDETACLLQPNITLPEGPYYVSGELVRPNGIEDLVGIGMLLYLQVIDVETCEPVQNQYVEFWHANQSGVYSGTVGNGNGNPDDESNLNNTWLRAIQPTDADGVAQVELLFPGHYAPRATHTHILVHQGGYVLPNNTLTVGDEGYISHVGQIFFDQDLIDAVDAYWPYSTNPNAILPNARDMVLSDEAVTTDPVTNYVYVGDDLADGILAWITVGINASAVYNVHPAAWWTADGGVENPDPPTAGNQGGGGGGPGGGGPGGPP